MLWRYLSVQRHLFMHDNSKNITAIKLKPDVQLPHRPLRNPICFGVDTLIFKVTEVTKVKFGQGSNVT